MGSEVWDAVQMSGRNTCLQLLEAFDHQHEVVLAPLEPPAQGAELRLLLRRTRLRRPQLRRQHVAPVVVQDGKLARRQPAAALVEDQLVGDRRQSGRLVSEHCDLGADVGADGADLGEARGGGPGRKGVDEGGGVVRARQRRPQRHQPHAVLTARRHRRLLDLPRLRRRLPRLDLAFGIPQRPAQRLGVRGLAPQPLAQFGGHLVFGVERGGELVACGAQLAGEPRAVAQRGVLGEETLHLLLVRRRRLLRAVELLLHELLVEAGHAEAGDL